MNKRLVSIGIVSLLVIGAFFGFITFGPDNASAAGATIYVDDDNFAGPWDGSLANPYRAITDGIAAATDGDTIRVFAGNYPANVVVDKSLTLIGNGTGNTIIDVGGGGYAVRINADWVNITGFTITNGDYGIYTNSYSHLNITHNNVSSNNQRGIYLVASSNNNITNNNVSGSGYNIWLDSCNDNNISANNITYGQYGIYLQYSPNCDILGNNFIEGGVFIYGGNQMLFYNTHDIPVNNILNGKPLYYYKDTSGLDIDGIPAGQIILANCTDVNVKNLQINNSVSGIELAFTQNANVTNNDLSDTYYGIALYGSSSCNVSSNELLNCQWAAHIDYCSDLDITNNNLSNSYIGFSISSSSNNDIIGNNVSSSSNNGIQLTSSHYNNITGNDVFLNGNRGIYLSSSSDNNIIGNNVSSNSYMGIDVYSSENNNFTGNNFINDGLFIWGGLLSHFNTHTIPTSNTVNGKPLYYYNDTNNLDIDGIQVGQLILANCPDADVKNLQINDTDVGIQIAYSQNVNVTNNDLFDNDFGLYYSYSDHGTVSKNDVTTNNDNGVNLFYSDNNLITQNNVTSNNGFGIYLSNSHDNNITHNNASWQIHGIYIFFSDGNTIDNNTVGNNIQYGIYVYNQCSNNIITNNTATDNDIGIYLAASGTFDNTVANNIVAGNSGNGIYLNTVYSITVTYNNISNNNIGIGFANADRNTITNNTVIQNTADGIYMSGGSDLNTFSDNDIVSNGRYGMYLISSSDTNIMNNNVSSNIETGIYLVASTQSNLINNTAYSNGDNGIWLDGGSSYNTIAENNASLNNQDGIILGGSGNNDIINNKINNNSYGIYLISSSDNNITDNDVWSNTDRGIYLFSASNNNKIADNNVSSNVNDGIFLELSSYTDISKNRVENNPRGIYLLDSHNNAVLNNTLINHSFGFFLFRANNNSIGHNIVLDTSNSNFGSCPVLYTWDGKGMKFFGDINGPGGLGYTFNMSMSGGGIERRAPTPMDYTAIDGSDLAPKDGSYVLEVVEDQDEITYFDEAELWVIDHDPDVEIYSPEAALATQTPYLHPPVIHTVRNPVQPLSATDWDGNDIISVIEAPDDVYTEAELLNDNFITLDLGDLSGASQIKLVYRAYTDWSPIGKVKLNQFAEVKNALGEWELVSGTEHFGKPEAMPRTYVIDITDWFKTDDWHLRLHTGTVKIHVDWVAFDTTPDEPVSVTVLQPSYANHYFKESKYGFEYFFGEFTKYGDVLPLLDETDDKFVIMRAGDGVELRFDEQPAPAGERDFWLVTDAFFKQPFVKYHLGNGISTVDPLPFHGMSNYPYPEGESYPYDAEHLTYLSDWNTREYAGGECAGMSLPNSDNNTVFNNTIIGDSGSVGLWLSSETNTSLINNNISKTWEGIYVDNSHEIIIEGNDISDAQYGGIDMWGSTNVTITDNTLSDCGISIGGDSVQYWNTHDIDTSNTVNGKPVQYWKDQNGGTIPPGAGQVILANCTNVKVENQELRHGSLGTELGFSSYNNMSGNNVSNNYKGIHLSYSSNNTITGNNASSNDNYGIELYQSPYNSITYNNVSYNGNLGIYLFRSDFNNITYNDVTWNAQYGFYLVISSSNRIYHNNIINNTNQAYEGSYVNYWNETYPIGGNYWSDYTGIDLNSTPTQDIPPPDGIGDTPYFIDLDSMDYYPFMNPVDFSSPIISDLLPPDGITINNSTPTIGANYSDESAINLSSVLLEVDSIDVTAFATITAGGVTYTPALALGEGIHNVSLVVKDIWGNTAKASWSFIVDTLPPGAITNLTAINPTVNSITLTWTAPGDDNYTGTASGYEVRYNTTGQITDLNWASSTIFTQSWVPLIANSTEVRVITGLSASTQYWFAVKAHDEVPNHAGISNSPTNTTTAPTPPSAPLNLKVYPGNGYVNITWDIPALDGGLPITGYNIYRNGTAGAYASVLAGQRWYNDTNVANGITYTYNVSAFNAVGEGPNSTISAMPMTMPSAPVNLQADAGNGYVNLTWDVPSFDGGSAITGYNIYRNGTAGAYGSVSAGQQWYNDTSVINGITYIYNVTAINIVGEGPSSTVSATPMTVPTAPQNLQASAGDGYVEITWDAPADNGDSVIINYTIYRGTTSGGETFYTEIGDVLYFNDTGLTNDVPYYYRVAAKNSVGEGPLSDEAAATPSGPMNQPPASTITSITSGETVKGTVEISGTASDSDGTVQRVEMKIDEDGNWFEVSGTSTWSYDLDTTTLSNGEHTIYIRSFDGESYSPETSISVEVANPTPKEEKSVFEETWFWALIVIVLIVIVMVLLLVMKARRIPAEEAIDEEIGKIPYETEPEEEIEEVEPEEEIKEEPEEEIEEAEPEEEVEEEEIKEAESELEFECPDCGTPLGATELVCPNCGLELEEEE